MVSFVFELPQGSFMLSVTTALCVLILLLLIPRWLYLPDNQCILVRLQSDRQSDRPNHPVELLVSLDMTVDELTNCYRKLFGIHEFTRLTVRRVSICGAVCGILSKGSAALKQYSVQHGQNILFCGLFLYGGAGANYIQLFNEYKPVGGVLSSSVAYDALVNLHFPAELVGCYLFWFKLESTEEITLSAFIRAVTFCTHMQQLLSDQDAMDNLIRLFGSLVVLPNKGTSYRAQQNLEVLKMVRLF